MIELTAKNTISRWANAKAGISRKKSVLHGMNISACITQQINSMANGADQDHMQETESVKSNLAVAELLLGFRCVSASWQNTRQLNTRSYCTWTPVWACAPMLLKLIIWWLCAIAYFLGRVLQKYVHKMQCVSPGSLCILKPEEGIRGVFFRRMRWQFFIHSKRCENPNTYTTNDVQPHGTSWWCLLFSFAPFWYFTMHPFRVRVPSSFPYSTRQGALWARISRWRTFWIIGRNNWQWYNFAAWWEGSLHPCWRKPRKCTQITRPSAIFSTPGHWQTYEDPMGWMIFNLVMDCLFICDILLNFFTVCRVTHGCQLLTLSFASRWPLVASPHDQHFFNPVPYVHIQSLEYIKARPLKFNRFCLLGICAPMHRPFDRTSTTWSSCTTRKRSPWIISRDGLLRWCWRGPLFGIVIGWRYWHVGLGFAYGGMEGWTLGFVGQFGLCISHFKLFLVTFWLCPIALMLG